MARHIKKGDQVMVISGGSKGQTGKVLRVLTSKERVVVEGINRVWKHVRPSQRYPQGGRIQKDAPIHLSNVMPIDPSTGKGTRVRYEMRDGVKHRIAVRKLGDGTHTDLGAVGKKAS
jgi:large subunit ribosomal protein L24